MSEYVRDELPDDTPELKNLKKLNDDVVSSGIELLRR
jgi:hypothetical protein